MLLSMLAMLVAGATASAASAAKTQDEWKVNGAALASGASQKITGKDKSVVTLTGKFAGTEVKFTSSKLKFGGWILGGKPGASEQTLVLEGVKVSWPGCTVKEETITTVGLVGELVEAAPAGVGNGKVDELFRPKAAEGAWTNFLIEGGEECHLNKIQFNMYGSLLTQFSPQKTEAKTSALLLEGFNGYTKEYKVWTGGAAKKAGLVWSGAAATLTGEAELELVSKEVFGAF